MHVQTGRRPLPNIDVLEERGRAPRMVGLLVIISIETGHLPRSRSVKKILLDI